MKYINVITGSIIDVESEISGKNWKLIRASDSNDEIIGDSKIEEPEESNVETTEVVSSKDKTLKKK